jgi:predicted acyl esterase
MEIVTEFAYKVREIEHCLIPLKDGTQLAARIWLPEVAGLQTFPAILEYLPYRKRDGTAVRDALTHPWMAGQGYVCVRVDMRGNGESQGLMADEYLLQEQDDALEVIDWLCQQPWCDGKVGMMGISWGGFNGLQVAGRQPADGELRLGCDHAQLQRGGARPAVGRRLENPLAATPGGHAAAGRNLAAAPDPR